MEGLKMMSPLRLGVRTIFITPGKDPKFQVSGAKVLEKKSCDIFIILFICLFLFVTHPRPKHTLT